jgi:hypothetical protein
MRVTITSNVDQVLGGMARLHPQFRFAAAKALTDTAREAWRGLPAAAEGAFDRPTQFTRSGFFVTPARKDSLVAVVGVKDRQATYLGFQVEGGRRSPRKVAIPLPSTVQLDTHGNLPRGTIRRLIAAARSGRKLRGKAAKQLGIAQKSEIFYGKPRGSRGLPAGIYSRRNAKGQRQLVPLIVFDRQPARYDKRFDFYGAAGRVFAQSFEANLARAWQQALASAR